MSTPVIFTITSDGLNAAFAAESNGVKLSLTNIVTLDSSGTQWGNFALSGGIVNLATNTARFSSILTSATEKQAYTLDILTSTGIIFATATSTTNPLVVVAANIDFAASFGLTLTGVPTGSVTITIDPDASIALAIMSQHVGAENPHPQYLTIDRATINGVDANLAITNNLGNDVAPYYKDLNLVFATGKFWVDSRCTNTPYSLKSSLYPADLGDVYGVLTVAVADGTSSATYFNCYQQLQTTTHIWTRRYLSTTSSSQSTGAWTQWTCGVSVNRALANGIDADLFVVANITTGDFDNLLDVGEYSCNDMSGHTPYAGAYGLLKVWRSGANIYQIFQSNSGLSGLWHRAYDSALNSWIAWERAASAEDLSGEVTRAESAEAALNLSVNNLNSQVATLIASAYPKVIAAGHAVMSGVDDTVNTIWTSTIYAPSGVDLTITSKWVVRWNTLGAGNDNNSNVRWSTALYAGYFLAKSYLADTSSNTLDGVGIMTYEIIQLSA
jgi:hypothetical protein